MVDRKVAAVRRKVGEASAIQTFSATGNLFSLFPTVAGLAHLLQNKRAIAGFGRWLRLCVVARIPSSHASSASAGR